MTLDAIDRKALTILMTRGRITWTELGQALGLSAPATAERARKLEEQGVVRGYAALVDPEAVEYRLLAFVAVSLANQKARTTFLAGIRKLDEAVECHHVTGDDDYLLKLRCRDTRDLDRLLGLLKEKLGVSRSRTTIVLGTEKETVTVPIAP